MALLLGRGIQAIGTTGTAALTVIPAKKSAAATQETKRAA